MAIVLFYLFLQLLSQTNYRESSLNPVIGVNSLFQINLVQFTLAGVGKKS